MRKCATDIPVVATIRVLLMEYGKTCVELHSLNALSQDSINRTRIFNANKRLDWVEEKIVNLLGEGGLWEKEKQAV